MKNELMINNNENFLQEEQKRVYSSKSMKTIEDKKELFNALEECDVLINDCVGETIDIKDFYIEEYDKTDEDTGEIKTKYRTIIFDKDGKSYATGSYGIYNSIKKLIMVYGYPTYTDEVKVKISKKKTKNGNQSLSLILM
mgnify:CR=1 FL=1